MSSISQFLVEILGPDGASALEKATARSQELGNALLPRSILAWINTSPEQFQGELPGTALPAGFIKSEAGYSGYVGVGSDIYRFANASLFHVTASVAVALGAQGEGIAAARGIHLEQLGKSIDLLAKSQRLHKELAKKSPPGKFNDLPEKLKDEGYPADKAFAIAWAQKNKEKKSEDLEKEELEKNKDAVNNPGAPGPSHAPQKPAMPEPPQKVAPPLPAPKMKPNRPKIPRPAKPATGATLKLTRSEARKDCELCGIPQFTGEEFTACYCLRVLAKSAKVVSFGDEVVLELDPEDWDLEARTTLLQTVGRK